MPRVIEWGTRGKGGSSFHVTIATPAYGDVEPQYALSLAATASELEYEGIDCSIQMLIGDCHVDDARNHIVRNFLETDSDFLFFIDADVGWKPKDFMRVLNVPRPFVLACYPYKGQEGFPVFFEQQELWADEHGAAECLGGPTGFMRLHRSVLEAVYDAEEGHFYSRADDPARRLPMKQVFMREIGGERRRGGDTAFCLKWRNLGGKIYVVPDVTFTHHGKKGWTGNLAQYCMERSKVLSAEIPGLVGRLAEEGPEREIVARLRALWGNTGHAATAEFLVECYRHAAVATGPILETGSGLSTLFLGAAAQAAGVEVHSLDHDVEWHERSEFAVHACGLEHVSVHYAPLKRDPDGLVWYDRSFVPDLEETRFALTVCDGPVRMMSDSGLYGREGLFELMGGQLDGPVVMDDANSPRLLRALQAWAHEKGFEVSVGGNSRKLAIARPKPETIQAAE